MSSSPSHASQQTTDRARIHSNQQTTPSQYGESQSNSEHVLRPPSGPTLADASVPRSTGPSTSDVSGDGMSGNDILAAPDTISENISEDIGPRTRHRKAKPKPGIPFKVLKARAAAAAAAEEDDDEDDGPVGLISYLPAELLARIIANLDPSSMVQCSSVCRAFRAIVSDDSTWRLAFALAFGIEQVGEQIVSDKSHTPLLRRVDSSSWKMEYTKRIERVRQWRKARAPTVLCDARIDFIDRIAFSAPHNFLLCASSSIGVASRCDPFNGKVAKGYLDVSGIVHGANLTTLGSTSGVSCFCLEADATRIIWGFHNGSVGMTTLARQGANPRGAIRGVHFSPRGSHIGPVRDIVMPFGSGFGGAHSIERSPEKLRQRQAALGDASETFVTCGVDGRVKLWSPKRALPLWTGVVRNDKRAATSGSTRPASALRLAFHLESGTIAAATNDGQLTLWTKIDIAALLNLSPFAFDAPTTIEPTASQRTWQKELNAIQDRIVKKELPNITVANNEESFAQLKLFLDVEESEMRHNSEQVSFTRASLLVYCPSAATFERHTIDLQNPELPASCAVYHCPDQDDEITCLRPDFDVVRTPVRGITAIGIVTKSDSGSVAASLQPEQRASPAIFSERKLVCAGTRRGKLLVWDWEQMPDPVGQVGARFRLDAHHTSITAIDVAEHAVLIGASDGTIKAFCPLSGQHIRTFNDRTATRHPARMLAAGQLTPQQSSRFHVSQIIAGEDSIVACIGAQLLAWRAEKIRTKANATGRKATSRTGRNAVGRLWDPKMQSMKEMERDVFETQQELQVEHEERLADRQRVGSRVEINLDGLTEQEAFEYAMMLSRDEMEANDGTLGSRGLEDALEQIARVESMSADSSRRVSPRAEDRRQMRDGSEADEGFEEDETADAESRENSHDTFEDVERFYTHRNSRQTSQSPSPMTSPYLRAINSPPSRAWDIIQSAGSSASRNTRVGDAFSKVQAVHVPVSARHTAQASSFVSPSSLSSNRRTSQTPGSVHSTSNDWPAFDQYSTSMNGKSPSRLDLGSPVPRSPSRRPSWGGAAPAPAPDALGSGHQSSAVPSPSPSSSLQKRNSFLGGAWANGSPSLRPANGQKPTSNGLRPASSALADSRPSDDADTNDDADLRFAIELSLAEERSRQEGQKGKGRDVAK